MNKYSTLRQSLLGLILCGFVTSTVMAKSSPMSLSGWTNRDLIPYITTRLTEHPRFRGETVAIVALDGNTPAPITNALALALRDRLVSAIIDVPGIALRQEINHGSADRGTEDIDCNHATAKYYIGLEVIPLINKRHRVIMRVLDVEDHSWVTGFTRAWEGRLSSAQRRGFARIETDESFRGVREAPFNNSQADMLATYLAHDLSCALSRQVAGKYIIAVDATPDNATTLAGMIELVSNNLARDPSLHIASRMTAANAVLNGKAHQISGDLYQYWVTVTPSGDSDFLPTVSVSAYVHLPDQPGTKNTDRPIDQGPPIITPIPARATSTTFLTPIRIVEPRQRRACYRGGSSGWRQQLVTADYTVKRGECFLLQTRANRDAIIFLLNYQVNNGLVRMSGSNCTPATQRITIRAGEQLQFPTAGDSRPSASAWQGQQGLESFYTVAVSHPEAAQELSVLIDRLPTRCTLSAAAGLTGAELRNWIGSLNTVVDRWPNDVDWQAVRIRHVY